MATKRIFDIQGFSGGESDDVTRGPKDSFHAGENIEVRKDLSGVKLTSAMVDTGWSISGDIICMEDLSKYGLSGIVVATDTGNIYLDGTLKKTLAIGTSAYNRVRALGVVKVGATTYIYYISEDSFGTGKIHRSTTNLTTWNDSYREYNTTGTSGESVFSIQSNGCFVFGVNNQTFIFDTVETVINGLFIPDNEGIVGMTLFQNNYKVYANCGTTSTQYYWDGLSESPTYVTKWYDSPIMGVVNNGAYDYAVFGYNEAYSDLYLISGTQRQELRVNLETGPYSRRLRGYMSIREDIVYISGGKSGGSSNYGIYTYGNYYPGTSKSMVFSYSKGTNYFLYQTHNTATSYFACSDDKVYKIEHNDTPSTLGYATSGYVVTQFYEGISWEKKTIDNILIGHKIGGGTYKVYLRKDIADSWTLIKTVGSSYNDKKYVRILANELKDFGSFNEIQIKIELIPGEATGVKVYTPIVKRITCNMTVIE